MLIFEITKTNLHLPQKGLTPILIDPPHIYVAYATQATINSVKHKELFHRNYLEKYVPGTFIPPDLLLSAFPSRSTEKIRQIVWRLNVRYAHVSSQAYAPLLDV